MREYLYAFVVVFITTYLLNVESGHLESFACSDGSKLALSEQTMTHDEANNYCQRLQSHQIDDRSADIVSVSQSLCGATLTGKHYWVAPCSTVQMTKERLHLQRATDCKAEKAAPICKRQGNFTLSDTPMVSSPKPSLPESCHSKNDWITFDFLGYCISNNQYKYSEALSYCNGVNSTLAQISALSLRTVLHQLKISTSRTVTIWGNATNIPCDSKCALRLYSMGKVTPAVVNDRTTLRILCQRSPVSTATTPITATGLPSSAAASTVDVKPSVNTLVTTSSNRSLTTISSGDTKADQTWIKIKQSEYCVINKEDDYETANEHCNRTYGASLVTFLNPISYFEVFAKLHLAHNSFWIRANANKTLQISHCIAYHGDNQTISPKPCGDVAFSVCRRSIYHNNTDEALLHPQFIQLLKEMTVEKSETSMNKRNLVSVEDKRPSAKTAGGLGVFILCFILSTMVILDLTRLKK